MAKVNTGSTETPRAPAYQHASCVDLGAELAGRIDLGAPLVATPIDRNRLHFATLALEAVAQLCNQAADNDGHLHAVSADNMAILLNLINVEVREACGNA